MMGRTVKKNIKMPLETYGEKTSARLKRDWASINTVSEAVDMMISGVMNIGQGMFEMFMAIFFMIAFAFSIAFDGLRELVKKKKK